MLTDEQISVIETTLATFGSSQGFAIALKEYRQLQRQPVIDAFKIQMATLERLHPESFAKVKTTLPPTVKQDLESFVTAYRGKSLPKIVKAEAKVISVRANS